MGGAATDGIKVVTPGPLCRQIRGTRHTRVEVVSCTMWSAAEQGFHPPRVPRQMRKIGRASCRERVCLYV